ncbi:winged helix-turn-helix domain-containing protein [Pseudoalteromonas sp. B131b]|uniref:winged helix-turn-helix domain-containing protein n=1 Tax=Pseudoalteromonas sp. B131b TaxID=630493 RepID=UPI00301C6614
MKEVNFPRSVKEIKFGAWSLNPKLQIISDGEVERELEPLLFKILCYLIINKDEIITRQDLVDDVWCQHYVDDNAINRAMSELRKVLKSEIQRGLVVKTHYRKGYSFFRAGSYLL